MSRWYAQCVSLLRRNMAICSFLSFLSFSNRARLPKVCPGRRGFRRSSVLKLRKSSTSAFPSLSLVHQCEFDHLFSFSYWLVKTCFSCVSTSKKPFEITLEWKSIWWRCMKLVHLPCMLLSHVWHISCSQLYFTHLVLHSSSLMTVPSGIQTWKIIYFPSNFKLVVSIMFFLK